MGGVFHNKKISQASRFNGGSRDGVAIFYNTDKLECIFSDKFVLPDDKGKDSTQVGLYVVLRDIKTREIFSYVAAHCKSGKKKKDAPTKDAQATFIANLVTMLACNGLHPALGLDFNSNYKEKVIETFKGGAKHMVSTYEQTEDKDLEDAYKVYQPLTEENAHKPEENGKAPMTAWKNRLFGEQLEKAGKQFKEELDYIFCEKKAWDVLRVLKVPLRSDIEACKLPGWKYPSDHFMIMAELELTPPSCTVMMSKAKLGLGQYYRSHIQEVTLSFKRLSNGKVQCHVETTKKGGHYSKLNPFGYGVFNIFAQEDVEFGWTDLKTIDNLNREDGTIRLCRQGMFGMVDLERQIHLEDEGTDKVALSKALEWINRQESAPLKSISHRSVVHPKVLAYLSDPEGSPAAQVLQRRRLADAARMEAKDVDAMSPAELGRRRLTHGARVSPVLAALMDEIEEAKRSSFP